MKSFPDVEDLIRKTRQYEFADGLRDLQLGAYLWVSGLMWWVIFERFWIALLLDLRQNVGRWAVWGATLALILLPVLAFYGIFTLTKALRRRWLWRTSGMVKPARWMTPRRINLISFVIFIGGLGLGYGLKALLDADDFFLWRMFLAALGWAFGYMLISLGKHISISRYRWLGGLGGLSTTLFIFFPLSFGQAGLAFCTGWGMLLIASGIVTLRQAWLASGGVNDGG